MSESSFDRYDGSGLDARVIDSSGSEPRIHGYALGSDLACHYNLAEVLLLTFRGEFGTSDDVRVFELGLLCAMDVSVGDAAGHATRMSRHLAHPTNNETVVPTIGAIAAAEMTRFQLDRFAPLIEWLDSDREAELPPCARDGGTDDRVRALAAEVGDRCGLGAFFERDPSAIAASVALLWSAGLRELPVIAAALTAVRVPVVVAEAFAVDDPRLWKYPLNLPFWDYTPERRDD